MAVEGRFGGGGLAPEEDGQQVEAPLWPFAYAKQTTFIAEVKVRTFDVCLLCASWDTFHAPAAAVFPAWVSSLPRFAAASIPSL